MSQSEQQAVAEEQQQPEQSLMSSVEVSHETDGQPNDGSIPHLEGQETSEDINWAEIERPDDIPAKFWSDENGPDIEALGKGYSELEKMFHAGKHKAPEEYDVGVLEEFNIPNDDPVASFYLDWAKNNGVSQAAFDDLAKTFLGNSVENAQAQAVDMAREKEALGANANEIISGNVKWADGLVQKGIISEDEREELDIWGGTAAGQRLMQKMRAMQGDMVQIPTNLVDSPSQSEDDFRTEMQEKMSDPRYGVDASYTRSVEKEFEARYR